MSKILIFCLCICLSAGSLSQNLVPNPDFEIYDVCPVSYLSKKKFLPYWYSPTIGTPDYFNKCSRYEAGIPDNSVGKVNPRSGVACAGIIGANLSGDSDLKYYSREYIAARLNEKLVKQEKYCVEFYVSLADYCKVAIDEMGLYFSKRKVYKLIKKELPFTPQITYKGRRLQNKEDWILVCGIYEAKGNEKYIIIGNFQNDDDLKWTWFDDEQSIESPITTGAYYYIDDVSVFPVENETECGCLKDEDKTINQ